MSTKRMSRSPRVQPNEEPIEKLRQEVQVAAEAYFRAANAHKEVIVRARAEGWITDADGHHSLYSAARLEHHTLERYAQLVKALKDAVLNAPKPAKRPNARAQKLGGKPLSPREREVLKLIAEGFSSREIADKLKISFKTAVVHRYHIMGKLRIHDVATLVRYALRNNLIEP